MPRARLAMKPPAWIAPMMTGSVVPISLTPTMLISVATRLETVTGQVRRATKKV